MRDNVQRLREGQNLTFAELARRLEAVGRPMPTIGLRRLEAGERRVDADDLAALAVALGTSPASLLMPDADGPEAEVLVTGHLERVSANTLWRWLLSRAPLAVPSRPLAPRRGAADSASAAVARDQFDQFSHRARPRWFRHDGAHALQIAAGALARYVDEAVSTNDVERYLLSLPEDRKQLAVLVRRQLAKLSQMAELLEDGHDVLTRWPESAVRPDGAVSEEDHSGDR